MDDALDETVMEDIGVLTMGVAIGVVGVIEEGIGL
jgi:hypothetical protein